MSATAAITVQVNGTTISPEKIRRSDETTFEADLAAPPLGQGINHLVFLPGRHSNGRLGSQVTGAELSVRYK